MGVLVGREVEAGPGDVLVARAEAERAFDGAGATANAINDPLQDAHVLTIARPDELAVLVLAEPVDAEDRRQLESLVSAGLDPVTPVGGHVVADERQHGERVAADRGLANGGCGRFRAHRRGHEHAVVPAKRLIDQREGLRQATTEQERRDRHAGRIFPRRIDRRALAGRSGEAGVRVGTGGAGLRRPVVTLPVDAVCRRRAHAFPPDAAIVGQDDVGVDAVAGLHRVHRHRVGRVRRSRGDAEEAVLRVDGAERAVGSRLDPGDVVTDGIGLPALETFGRQDHREVGLAAGAREGGGDVGLFTLGRFEAEDQHVLGEPALVAGHRRGNAQRQAFLAEEGVAAVTGAIRPNLARFREVADVLTTDIGLAWPCYVLLTRLQRCADRVDAGDEVAVAEDVENRLSHAGHNPHVGSDVGAVADLHPNLGDRRAERAHREWDDVHRAAAHAAVILTTEDALHLLRVFPVVGRPGLFLGLGADVSPVLNAGDVARVGAGEEAVRVFLRVQANKCPRLDHLFAKIIVFGLGAVTPMYFFRFAQGCPLVHPREQLRVLRWS